jgi:hypothetical protein
MSSCLYDEILTIRAPGPGLSMDGRQQSIGEDKMTELRCERDEGLSKRDTNRRYANQSLRSMKT